MTSGVIRILALCAFVIMLSGCGAPKMLPPGFIAERDTKQIEAAPPDMIKAFEAALNKEYLLGPGDIVEIVSPVYPEIAGEQTLSPEGFMTVYPAGAVPVGGLTRGDAENRLKEALARYFNSLSLTLRVKSYENNQVLVLGKVATPGAVKFRSRPNLLEALAKSGAFPNGPTERRLTSCYIIRGKDQMLLVSINEMLKGASSNRNIDLASNDIVYIPENAENNVYILGEVVKPGVYEISTPMSLLNAILLAGGPTETAVTDGILLVRDRGGKPSEPLTFNLDRMINSGDLGTNVLLTNDDIVYVPRSGFGTFNFYLRMINPFTQLIFFGKTMAN